MRPLAIAVLLLAQQAVAQSENLEPVQIKYMLRGYYYASSNRGVDGLDGYGGWGGSGNSSTRFVPAEGAKGLEIVVDTLAIVPLDSTYQGRRVVVRNNGPDTLYFAAQDSRLYMKAQALRTDSFADIEYLPSSWCGNSYHTLFLAPGWQWTFVMPNYDGPEPTRLRLELAYGPHPMGDKEQLVYSRTFAGAVDPKQFTKKLDYQPGGLMDPYND